MAKWIAKETMIRTITAKNHYCSHCGRDTSELTQYCADCGNFMENGVNKFISNNVIDYRVEQDVKKYLGIYPFNEDTNVVKYDGYFYKCMCGKYGKESVDIAIKTLGENNR